MSRKGGSIRKTTKGAPKLSDEAIEKAVKLLDGWSGKLTWDRYLSVLAVDLGHHYTKVAMLNQPRVRSAWDEAKTRSRQSSVGVGFGDVAIAQAKARIETLQNRVQRLEKENEALLAQFLRWSHNANRLGLSPKDLDRPLPIASRLNCVSFERHILGVEAMHLT